jgi:hypothetical protein
MRRQDGSAGATIVRGRERSVAVLFLVCAAAAACSQPAAVAPSKAPAVTVEKIEGSELERLTLSTKAAQRLGVQATAVRTARGSDASRTIIPYAAVIYDSKGGTWAYQNVEGLVFVRQPITIEAVSEGEAILSAGPPPDAMVVTVGAAELYGVETGVGGGH